MSIYDYVRELSDRQEYAKDVRPASGGFSKKYAKYRGTSPLALSADLVADYREWVSGNSKERESLIHAVMLSGYKLSAVADTVTSGCRVTAYANFWSMPDSGYGLVVDAPSPSEGLLRAAWCVVFVAHLDISRLIAKNGQIAGHFHDPWAEF